MKRLSPSTATGGSPSASIHTQDSGAQDAKCGVVLAEVPPCPCTDASHWIHRSHGTSMPWQHGKMLVLTCPVSLGAGHPLRTRAIHPVPSLRPWSTFGRCTVCRRGGGPASFGPVPPRVFARVKWCDRGFPDTASHRDVRGFSRGKRDLSERKGADPKGGEILQGESTTSTDVSDRGARCDTTWEPAQGPRRCRREHVRARLRGSFDWV